MATLSNEQTRQGGINPSGNGLASDSQLMTEQRLTWDGSNCIPTRTHSEWYLLRTTNNRIFKAGDALSDYGIETYIPTHMIVKRIFGVRRRVKEPLLPGLVFVNSTKEAIDKFRNENPSSAVYIKYYLDKTAVKDGIGLNPPLVISSKDMENFRRVCDAKSDHTIPINPQTIRFKSNDMVIVTDGVFAGVIGKVVRVAGQQRVAVMLDDTIGVATAYIPDAFLEVINPGELQE